MMQIEQIVALLVAERNRLDAAIHALQGWVKRRRRPPGSGKRQVGAAMVPGVQPRRTAARVARKRTLSAAARKAMAAAAKKRWAAIKAGKAPNPFVKAKGTTRKKS